MQKTTFVLGAALMVVACAAAPDSEGTAASGAADTTRTTPSTRTGATRNASDAGTAPTSCYGGHGSCDPTDPNACGKGETCDINGGTGLFECFPPPNDAQLGDACDNSQGPFCAAGLACDQGTCKQYCCDDSICAAGTTCQHTGDVKDIVISVCQ